MSSHLGHRYHTSALIHHEFDVIRHITISILLTSTVKLSRVNLRCQNKLSKDEAIQPGLMPGVYSNSLSRTSRCCAFSHCVATPPSPPPQARPVAPAQPHEICLRTTIRQPQAASAIVRHRFQILTLSVVNSSAEGCRKKQLPQSKGTAACRISTASNKNGISPFIRSGQMKEPKIH